MKTITLLVFVILILGCLCQDTLVLDEAENLEDYQNTLETCVAERTYAKSKSCSCPSGTSKRTVPVKPSGGFKCVKSAPTPKPANVVGAGTTCKIRSVYPNNNKCGCPKYFGKHAVPVKPSGGFKCVLKTCVKPAKRTCQTNFEIENSAKTRAINDLVNKRNSNLKSFTVDFYQDQMRNAISEFQQNQLSAISDLESAFVKQEATQKADFFGVFLSILTPLSTFMPTSVNFTSVLRLGKALADQIQRQRSNKNVQSGRNAYHQAIALRSEVTATIKALNDQLSSDAPNARANFARLKTTLYDAIIKFKRGTPTLFEFRRNYFQDFLKGNNGYIQLSNYDGKTFNGLNWKVRFGQNSNTEAFAKQSLELVSNGCFNFAEWPSLGVKCDP